MARIRFDNSIDTDNNIRLMRRISKNEIKVLKSSGDETNDALNC